MFSNFKAALALLCLLALVVDALRPSSMENSVKKKRGTWYRKRNLPPVKRDLPVQRVTVRPRPLDNSGLRPMVAYFSPSSYPSITGATTRAPSRTGTGIMQRTISKAALFSVRDLRTPLYPASQPSPVQCLILGRATPNLSLLNLW